MKYFTPTLKASHVNAGTSIPRKELAGTDGSRAVIRSPKLHLETRPTTVTPYGGLAVVAEFFRRFGVAETIDEHVSVLKVHKPYHESDHVLSQAANLYTGGTCLEDGANLQHDEAVRRMLGAERLPDPTTAGDFLRRFDSERNPGALEALEQSIDEVQSQVHRVLHPRGGRRRRMAVVDVDGHIKPLYGAKKEGADFSHTKKWSYHPLLCTLAGTQECLGMRLRPGNRPSYEGAAELLEQVLPRLAPHFAQVLVRGDSDFDRSALRRVCYEHGAYFALVGREFKDRPRIVESIAEEDWQEYLPRSVRTRRERKRKKGYRKRRRKPERRQRRARERGYKEKSTVRQAVVERPYKAAGSDRPVRLVIRRQLIAHRKGQQLLFEEYEYRYIVTNLPRRYSTQKVVELTYQRCDQENSIEQLKSGLAAWRMPVAEFDGNAAWLQIARLAWNIGKWLAGLCLPPETVRWEWKRFRHAFVYMAAEVVRCGRQVWVRLSQSHRFVPTLVAAHIRLQT